MAEIIIALEIIHGHKFWSWTHLKPFTFLSLSWCLRQRMDSGTMTSSQESASGKWSKSQGLSWSPCMDQGTRAWRTWATVATSVLSCRPFSASQSSRERKCGPAADESPWAGPFCALGNPLLLPWGFCCIAVGVWLLILRPKESSHPVSQDGVRWGVLGDWATPHNQSSWLSDHTCAKNMSAIHLQRTPAWSFL